MAAGRTRQLQHPRGSSQSATGWIEGTEDSHPDIKPLHAAVLVRVLPQLHLRGPLLGRLHRNDQLPTGGNLHFCRLLPDGHLGPGQAPQLQEGVQGLPEEPKGYRALRSLEILKCFNQVVERTQSVAGRNDHCSAGMSAHYPQDK